MRIEYHRVRVSSGACPGVHAGKGSDRCTRLIAPGASEEEKTVEGTLPGDSAPSEIQVQAHGSATAFTGLADGSCDIGMASRKIKPDEIAKLSAMGDMTSPASEHILGLDGIAVIVNQANPLTSLTKDQLSKIFSGATTDWSAAGGGSGAIHLYARDDKSGTFDTFKSLVLGSANLASSARRFEDSSALSDAVANDANGIGFIGLPYVRSAKAIAVAEPGPCPSCPIALRSRRRTIRFPGVFISTRRPRRRTNTRGSLCSLPSPRPVRISWGPTLLWPRTWWGNAKPCPPVLRRSTGGLTNGAERLSVDFRFRTGVLTWTIRRSSIWIG